MSTWLDRDGRWVVDAGRPAEYDLEQGEVYALAPLPTHEEHAAKVAERQRRREEESAVRRAAFMEMPRPSIDASAVISQLMAAMKPS